MQIFARLYHFAVSVEKIASFNYWEIVEAWSLLNGVMEWYDIHDDDEELN